MGLAAVPDRGSRSAGAHARDPLRGDCSRSGDRRRADRKPARDGSGAPRRGAPPGPQPLDRPLAPRFGARAGRGRRARGRPALAPTGLRLSARRLPAELIPRIPRPVRAVLRNAVWTYGRATSFARPLPSFLILGAQKAGTTALYAYLRWHPGVTGPAWKEVSYFDRHYRRGVHWYRGHFPLRPGDRLVGEARPGDPLHPLPPERVRATVPDAKLIALLRDPVDRALSHYHHEVALGREPPTFEEAIEAEPERTRGEEERLARVPGYFHHGLCGFTDICPRRFAAPSLRRPAATP